MVHVLSHQIQTRLMVHWSLKESQCVSDLGGMMHVGVEGFLNAVPF